MLGKSDDYRRLHRVLGPIGFAIEQARINILLWAMQAYPAEGAAPGPPLSRPDEALGVGADRGKALCLLPLSASISLIVHARAGGHRAGGRVYISVCVCVWLNKYKSYRSLVKISTECDRQLRVHIYRATHPRKDAYSRIYQGVRNVKTRNRCAPRYLT
ncbi:hypothetical protein EVAR_6705_1 [Eumeta japonica]|uniref:Uncharacterized protein n=1 Tax=Eumeta variegata TaxID=151549 RepID=A0A4C1TLX4_EUMVA|nr:hypothetical protein EVAR_6705_1 [Eumeta japonica]